MLLVITMYLIDYFNCLSLFFFVVRLHLSWYVAALEPKSVIVEKSQFNMSTNKTLCKSINERLTLFLVNIPSVNIL